MEDTMKVSNFGAMVTAAIAGLAVSGYAYGKGHCEAASCSAKVSDECSAEHTCKGQKACGAKCTKEICEKDGKGTWKEDAAKKETKKKK